MFRFPFLSSDSILKIDGEIRCCKLWIVVLYSSMCVMGQVLKQVVYVTYAFWKSTWFRSAVSKKYSFIQHVDDQKSYNPNLNAWNTNVFNTQIMRGGLQWWSISSLLLLKTHTENELKILLSYITTSSEIETSNKFAN